MLNREILESVPAEEIGRLVEAETGPYRRVRKETVPQKYAIYLDGDRFPERVKNLLGLSQIEALPLEEKRLSAETEKSSIALQGELPFESPIAMARISRREQRRRKRALIEEDLANQA